MSFDQPAGPRRVAVVGGGVSGLAAAYHLAEQHHVTLMEAAPKLGGHARTVIAGRHADQPVDTGFIVFNYVNYPHLTGMFDRLDVPVETSDMSFAASINNGKIEYGLQTLSTLTGQRRNLLRPFFYGMIGDILKFNAHANQLQANDSLTIGEYVSDLRLGRWFRDYYLTPLCGAIWSTPAQQILDFPAAALIRFFKNHHLLTNRGHRQWWTVSGGSRSYVERLERHLTAKGVDIRTNCTVANVERTPAHVEVKPIDAPAERFDQIIFAGHPDQTLEILQNPTADEQRLLGAVRYQDNRMVLHRDPVHMPKRRKCWSSWVYRARLAEEQAGISVTYWMNRLQNIPLDDPLFVTLNPLDPVREECIYDEHTFRHPMFDHAAIKAQREVPTIQGLNRSWFAGAWLGNGFHEDGFASGLAAAQALLRVPA
ncbi:NAD(P)/FAD-dependent oxidoreductase [Qingshengfaniella alkalisoli]|uniref:FAD-dependent oxidoreductase n=1 Tax=Qingshengfaniella alkalisoli TaxID=2599296 RepID=A0A5B8IB40_9RHOB|nr:FAD-dependent oxidoreductase [Qingshengfaniella alkalisoli]QDY70596.1 FAD-dependent oxidoreductase [Qingshengfaniella alkalisoli]